MLPAVVLKHIAELARSMLWRMHSWNSSWGLFTRLFIKASRAGSARLAPHSFTARLLLAPLQAALRAASLGRTWALQLGLCHAGKREMRLACCRSRGLLCGQGPGAGQHASPWGCLAAGHCWGGCIPHRPYASQLHLHCSSLDLRWLVGMMVLFLQRI